MRIVWKQDSGDSCFHFLVRESQSIVPEFLIVAFYREIIALVKFRYGVSSMGSIPLSESAVAIFLGQALQVVMAVLQQNLVVIHQLNFLDHKDKSKDVLINYLIYTLIYIEFCFLSVNILFIFVSYFIDLIFTT